MKPAFEFEKFNTQEFYQRWRQARISAFTPIESSVSSESQNDPENEENRINLFFSKIGSESMEVAEKEKSKDDLLRRVFDNSRKLALSLSNHLGMTFEIEDFEILLKASDILCFQGEWTTKNNARIVNRKGCNSCLESGSNTCDYWREALDGLVMGLGEKERMVRHASLRHGDSLCTDVFFTESNQIEEENPAWGPLPEHMALDLYEMSEYFQHTTGISIVLKGFREGILYYEFKAATDLLCGNSNLLDSKFHGLVKEKFPGLILKNVTPQAVLGTVAA